MYVVPGWSKGGLGVVSIAPYAIFLIYIVFQAHLETHPLTILLKINPS